MHAYGTMKRFHGSIKEELGPTNRQNNGRTRYKRKLKKRARRLAKLELQTA